MPALGQESWQRIQSMAIWLVVTVAAMIVLGAALFWVRRYAQRGMKGSHDSGELRIEQLEKMFRDGTISREEFSSLRRKVLGVGGALASGPRGLARAPAPPSGKGGENLTRAPSDVDENMKPEEQDGPPGMEQARP
jgi:hypothetical protein